MPRPSLQGCRHRAMRDRKLPAAGDLTAAADLSPPSPAILQTTLLLPFTHLQSRQLWSARRPRKGRRSACPSSTLAAFSCSNKCKRKAVGFHIRTLASISSNTTPPPDFTPHLSSSLQLSRAFLHLPPHDLHCCPCVSRVRVTRRRRCVATRCATPAAVAPPGAGLPDREGGRAEK